MSYLKTAALLVLAMGATAKADFIAFDTPTTTLGNFGGFSGSVGLGFDVTAPVQITQLGVFDSGADGLSSDFTVQIYDRDTQASIASVFIPAGTSSTLVGSDRFVSLATPLILNAGFHGQVVTSGFSSADPYYNIRLAPGTIPSNLDTGGGLIAFLNDGGGFFGSANNYPAAPENFPAANPYSASTFAFVSAVPEPSSIALLGLGVAGLFGLGARRRMAVRV